jgi:peptidyl-prolyl cis-trans isomerase SurA
MKQLKIKKRLIPILALLGILVCSNYSFPEIIEKIYAVVNGELITYSELKNAERELTRAFSQQYKGEELAQKLTEMKKNLLDRLIEEKILLSYAKEKNYDVDGEVELFIKDIKKQNNIATDEELRQALASQGMDYEEWKTQLKENRLQNRFIMETVGSKIKIDNSAIMAYYKENIKDYTLPPKFKLNCIYLDKNVYVGNDAALTEKKNTIETQLKTSPFEETAKKYTELPGGDILLGEFKQGELDPALEKAALEMKKDDISGWLETENGWYILQLVEKTESQLVEYKEVRNEIEYTLRMKEQDKKVGEYMKELKKDSHIEIIEKF